MAGSIQYDKAGSSISSGINGEQWNRRYLAIDLEGADVPSIYSEVYQLIPDNGTPAPAPIVNMFVSNATIDFIGFQHGDPQGRRFARGTITYTSPAAASGPLGTPDDDGPGVTTSIAATVEEYETDRDVNGDQITTTYDNATMAHSVRTFRTLKNLTHTRLEATNPEARINAHQGTLNQFAWNGYAAKTVYLADLGVETRDRGQSWLCQYQFVIKSTWQIRFVHEDPFFPGRPLPGATGAAETLVDVLPVSDFGALNLTL